MLYINVKVMSCCEKGCFITVSCYDDDDCDDDGYYYFICTHDFCPRQGTVFDTQSWKLICDLQLMPSP